jgi:hypothetical protein
MKTNASTDWMIKHGLKWLLFLSFPLIACLLIFCVVVICVAAWIVIPIGKPVLEGTSWTLNFPWSSK